VQNHTPVTMVRCASREWNRRDRECTQTGNDKQVHSQHVREGKNAYAWSVDFVSPSLPERLAERL